MLNNTMIIGIHGKKYHGKTTICNMINELTGIEVTNFAKPLKDGCQKIYGLTDEEMNDPVLKEAFIPRLNASPRQIMQKFGEAFRDISLSFRDDDNFWIERWKAEHSNKPNVVIGDVRYQNEVDFIELKGGCVIHVIRNSVQSNDTHSSESGNLSIKKAFVIFNDCTLEELKELVNDTLQMIPLM